MATEREIEKARDMLRDQQGYIGQPRSRIHASAASERVARMNALEHPVCRDCSNLILSSEKGHSPTGEVVVLKCKAGLTPTDWWISYYPLDPEPTCPKFSPIVSEEIAQ